MTYQDIIKHEIDLLRRQEISARARGDFDVADYLRQLADVVHDPDWLTCQVPARQWTPWRPSPAPARLAGVNHYKPWELS